MKINSSERLDDVNSLGNVYSIDRKALISHLSKTYSIDETLLTKQILVETVLVDIIRPDNFSSRRRAGIGFDLPQPENFGSKRLLNDRAAHYHLGIMNDVVKLRFGKRYKSYNSLSHFLKEFPQVILFIVPLYGAFEYSNDNLTIQKAVKKFAVEFGKNVADQVVVFDYWGKRDFDYEQYSAQERAIMRRFKIRATDVPCVLIANRSPFTLGGRDKSKKLVILKFRNFGISQLSPRLLEIAADLERGNLPSEWLHDWKRLISWAKSKGIGTKAVGIGLKAAKLGI